MLQAQSAINKGHSWEGWVSWGLIRLYRRIYTFVIWTLDIKSCHLLRVFGSWWYYNDFCHILSKWLRIGMKILHLQHTEMMKWNQTSEFDEIKNLPSDTLCSQVSKSLQIRAGLSRVPRGFLMLCSKLLR